MKSIRSESVSWEIVSGFMVLLKAEAFVGASVDTLSLKKDILVSIVPCTLANFASN